MATIEDRTLWALQRVMGPQRDLTPTASLEVDLDMDSLDRVELVMEIEQEFKVEVTDEQGDRLKTWGDVRKLVDKLVASKKAKETRDVVSSDERKQHADAAGAV
jgi:acyl carrier protein